MTGVFSMISCAGVSLLRPSHHALADDGAERRGQLAADRVALIRREEVEDASMEVAALVV